MNDCVTRNFESKDYFLSSPIHKSRYEILLSFISGFGKVLDVGCGSFLPALLGINYACDIDPMAEHFLRKQNWRGEFKVCDCARLPYKDKEFDVAICSEVIEHLDSKARVKKAFMELDRVSKFWIVTTPSAYDGDPDHKFHFGYDDDNLFDFIPGELDFIVIRKGYYYYISNYKGKLKDITGVDG